MKAIKGAKIVIGNKILEDHVLVFDENIKAIESSENFAKRLTIGDEEIEVITCEGTLVPGFVDIHIHGACGHDVMDGSFEAIDGIAKGIVKTGTTAFLATTMTMAQSLIEKSLDETRGYIAHQTACTLAEKPAGAMVVGVHLEGPFINPIFKGAQAIEHIQKPTKTWIAPHLDIVKMITLAPEMDENFAFIKEMKNTGVVLSMGHTGSDYETAIAAYDEGVHHVTHCFNAMTGLHHRKPGVVGAVLAKPFTMDLIADGIHIHPGFVGPFIKLKGTDQTVLITDAMRAALMPEGDYDLGGQKVIMKDNSCRLEDGTLAGSVLSTGQALKNLLKFSDLELVEIVKMLSGNPAKLIGLGESMGSLEVGKLANIVLLDGEMEVKKVYVHGILN
ncbi:N-acetylglucosamine-6-phosphate deacetylase [Fusibacter bizertensis]|uniref:N-acetylglucosamine-6-phosphate deacetylase n=1 Tax=Fusibacter bizertensis TaxID=1488331 RepID=A0ABT6NE72_9FIRM|nr:N-acetylglucosamine-6-phosphate deacetylase [Fusibacter bizertensis]MDH8678710.1 N-acetylglucosamine-6-phosphate deacetylase [Fusibacter bizertensis]